MVRNDVLGSCGVSHSHEGVDLYGVLKRLSLLSRLALATFDTNQSFVD